MTVGCFLGIRRSYIPQARDVADAYLAAIRDAQQAAGQTPYVEPDQVSKRTGYHGDLFGRSMLDHHSAGPIAEIGELGNADDLATMLKANPPQKGWITRLMGGGPKNPPPPPQVNSHLALIAMNAHRSVFLPTDFPHPLRTTHREMGLVCWVGSSPRLLAELIAVAPKLGVFLENGALSDELALKLNDSVDSEDDDDDAEDESDESSLPDQQSAWLLLHEGARLSIEHGLALSLHG